MVLDDVIEIDLLKRLKKSGFGECLKPLEKAEIVFNGGQSRIFYVGGIFKDQIVYSLCVDVYGNLEPQIQRIPLTAVKTYRTLN